MSARARWGLPGPVLVLLAVSILVVVFFPAYREYAGFIGLVVGLLTAEILFIRRSRSLPRREKHAWRGMGVGIFFMATGVVVVGYLSETGVELSVFGPVDIFFLAGYAMLVFSLTQLARAESGGSDWVLVILDALVGAIALFALVWTAFYSQLIEAVSTAPWWQVVIASVYPILDMAAIVTLMILVMRRSQFRLDLRLVFVVIGLSFQVIADFIILSRGLGTSFAESEPAWALNLLASIFLLLTATVVDVTPRIRVFPEADTPIWALLWPYLLVGALLGVHVFRYRRMNPGIEEIVLLDAVLAVGAVIFLRQLVVIRRNRTKVNQQRSELVASVSHELRTPLTAILGYLSLLDQRSEEFEEAPRQEMIGEATDQARHMARLIADLLMIAKGQDARLQVKPEDVSLVDLVNSTLRVIDRDGVEVEAEIEGSTSIRVDPDRIKQALANLLSNAVRYGGDKTVLKAEATKSDLTFEIHDNGPGIPTEFETMIWQRFERGAHRLDSTAPGLGIGLAIVRAVADAHDGEATYRQSEGLGGACFSITLPGSVLASDPAVEVLETTR